MRLDYYLIDLSGLELNDQVIPLEVSIGSFCGASTPAYELNILRETGAIGSEEYTVEPTDLTSVDGADLHRVMLTQSARYWVKLRSLDGRGGAYAITFELRSPE